MLPVKIELDPVCLLKLTVRVTSHWYGIKSNEVGCSTALG